MRSLATVNLAKAYAGLGKMEQARSYCRWESISHHLRWFKSNKNFLQLHFQLKICRLKVVILAIAAWPWTSWTTEARGWQQKTLMHLLLQKLSQSFLQYMNKWTSLRKP
jgi:hypothetical protein